MAHQWSLNPGIVRVYGKQGLPYSFLLSYVFPAYLLAHLNESLMLGVEARNLSLLDTYSATKIFLPLGP